MWKVFVATFDYIILRLVLVPFWIIVTPSKKNERLYVDFEESGSLSLLVIMASKKYASFNFGKENFRCGK